MPQWCCIENTSFYVKDLLQEANCKKNEPYWQSLIVKIYYFITVDTEIKVLRHYISCFFQFSILVYFG